MAPTDATTLARVRVALLLVLVVEILGIGAELVLIAHYADPWQWAPLSLMAAALLVIAWHALDRRAAPLRALQAILALFLLSGGVGTVLHYRAKVAFQLEVNPSLAGSALFWEAMKSISPPALAPGVMMQMGLLGFLYTYRHPALRKPADDPARIEM